MIFQIECVIFCSFYIFSIARYTNIYSFRKIDNARLNEMEKKIRELKIFASKTSCKDVFGTSNLPQFKLPRSDQDLIKEFARRINIFYNKCPDEAATHFELPMGFKMPQKNIFRLRAGLFFGKRKTENRRQTKTKAQRKKRDNDSKRKHAKTDNKKSHVETKNDSSLNNSKHTKIGLADTHAQLKGPDMKLENKIRNQLEEQISRLQKSNSRYIPLTSNMIFILRKQCTPISIVKIAKDGNCLFGALAHQLFCDNVNSPAYNKNVAKLRAEAVKYLIDNMEFCEYLFKWRIPELTKIENIEIDPHCYVNSFLSRPGFWGGTESMKAVSAIYKVNIIIINENSTHYLPFGFNFDFERTICIAYRLNPMPGEELYDHYDSVYQIPENFLNSIVEHSANIEKNKIQGECIEID